MSVELVDPLLPDRGTHTTIDADPIRTGTQAKLADQHYFN